MIIYLFNIAIIQTSCSLSPIFKEYYIPHPIIVGILILLYFILKNTLVKLELHRLKLMPIYLIFSILFCSMQYYVYNDERINGACLIVN